MGNNDSNVELEHMIFFFADYHILLPIATNKTHSHPNTSQRGCFFICYIVSHVSTI